ncbi:MAG: hypothetical protein ABEJ30_08990 [Halorientalis sp.]
MATETAHWLTFDGVSFNPESFSRVWLLALATYGVGDVVTTIGLVWFSPVHVEANPVIAAAIALFGGGGFLALKLLAFYVCLGISLTALGDEDPFVFYVPPLTLAAIGLFTTLYNLSLVV